jgi:hypothetical protein
MKKQFLKLAVLLAMPLVIITSCSKEEEEKKDATQISGLGTATITGRLTGDVILNNGQLEGLSGVRVTARINTSDLIAVGSVPGGLIRTYEATTDANGFYTLNIEAGSRPVGVTFDIPAAAIVEQTLENGSKVRTTFNRITVFSGFISMNKGQVFTQDAQYNFALPTTKSSVTLEADVFFRSDLCKGVSPQLDSQLTTAPANTMFRITWTDDNSYAREAIVKTDANGKFTFSVETSNASKTLTVRGIKVYADRKRDIDGDGNCDTETNYDYTTGSMSFTILKGETNKEEIEFN